MDKKERDKFDRQLVARDPGRTSFGTKDLLAVMGIPLPPPPSRDS